jgi:hypothetical protein
VKVSVIVCYSRVQKRNGWKDGLDHSMPVTFDGIVVFVLYDG